MKLTTDLSGAKATAIICPGCGWKGQDDDPMDGLVASGVAACPRCSRMGLEYEWEPGVQCGNCRKLALDMPLSDGHGSYCTRRCQLQAEHARNLEQQQKGV